MPDRIACSSCKLFRVEKKLNPKKKQAKKHECVIPHDDKHVQGPQKNQKTHLLKLHMEQNDWIDKQKKLGWANDVPSVVEPETESESEPESEIVESETESEPESESPPPPPKRSWSSKKPDLAMDTPLPPFVKPGKGPIAESFDKIIAAAMLSEKVLFALDELHRMKTAQTPTPMVSREEGAAETINLTL